MWRRFRPPLVLVTAALIVSIVLLAVFQYRWLGQISEAERAERHASLAAGATEFAQDFDREITRAYLLFQADPVSHAMPPENEDLAARFAARYDRWQATAKFPRLVKDFYAFTQDQSGANLLRRFDAASRQLEPVDWPSSMADWRTQLTADNVTEMSAGNSLFIRRMPSAIWESVPALVVPVPLFVMGTSGDVNVTKVAPALSLSILTIDRDYVSRELLPSLAESHFGHRAGTEGAPRLDFKVAVVSRSASPGIVFQSTPSFAPAFDATADATAEFFQVRTQDFATLAAEVRRFAGFVTNMTTTTSTTTATIKTDRPTGMAHFTSPEGRPLSIVIQPGVGSKLPAGTTTTSTRVQTGTPSPFWKLMVTHPAGSLEAAVAAQRRRNLAISSSILGLLGVSMGLLVMTTRRAQRLARQQMEFVAAVSHELRTPLAVIRSAAENLADGVVHDESRIRRYGELMRTEGRRLTEMVEQILEFAGIQSGQRGFALRPVAVEPLLRDIIATSAALIEGTGLTIEVDAPDDPAVLGDEAALRRVFQNLIDNAIKYGGSGGSIRLTARRDGSNVSVTVADRGIGIEPAEQARIFEPFYRTPDVVAAQVQGAGLGLSLVQRIVQAHGGRVTVKSAPRTGSEFTVSLPAADERQAAERAGQRAPSEGRGVEAARFS